MVTRVNARSQRERLAKAGIWLGWWAGLMLLWLALVDTVDLAEMLVGAVAAAIASTVGLAVHQRGYIRFQPRAAWLLQAPSLVGSVVVDCALLTGALWRKTVKREPVRGVTIRVPFHHGDESGRDGARRALVNFAVSLTPNSYVVDIDPEADSLLVHRLVPAPLDRVLRREQERATTRSESWGRGAEP